MENVLYLLGAGASANTIPVVKNLEQTFSISRQILDSQIYCGEEQFTIPEQDRKKISDNLEAIKSYWSFDTYAKYLHDNDMQFELHELKKVLIFHFSILELRSATDPRYTNWLASIYSGQKHNPFPSIKILSWNYDLQLERALASYLGLSTLSEARISINRNDSSKYVKINGSCDELAITGPKNVKYLLDEIAEPVDFRTSNFGNRQQYFMLEIFKKIGYSKMIANFKFGWEKEVIQKQYHINETSYTSIHSLIIIGYSFPSVNRALDRSLFRSLPNLKRVYLQCPDAQKVSSYMRLNINEDVLKRIEIVPFESDGAFLIPPEL